MEKQGALKKLEEEMIHDASLPLQESNVVFGEGDPEASVVFVGEAPGLEENRLKRPFVGRAGRLLDELIATIGWKRGDVYITNIVKRRPPENRDPLPEEIAAYTPYLRDQIRIINPKAVVTLGRFAMHYFLPDAKITQDQGKAFNVQGQLVIPMLHPAAALRSATAMNHLRESFQKLPDILAGKVVPRNVAPTPPPHTPGPTIPPQAKLF